MSHAEIVYFIVALVYIAYPLYYLMSHPTRAKQRVLGLGLMVYGALALFWRHAPGSALVILGSTMIVLGFGIYLGVLWRLFAWLLLLLYSMLVFFWPAPMDPAATLVAAIVAVILFDRCITAANKTDNENGDGGH